MNIAQVTESMRSALGQVIVGQDHALEELLAAWLAGGHVLLEGVPGVAKTLTARAMAATLGLDFGRIQFTPDLMPADITGGSIFDFQRGQFQLQRGPIFCQVLLADEINRAPPKTQAALLEAMQERQVTIDGKAHPLNGGFFVVATQNPLEHEGTYPLPEAQLDRFLLRIVVDYPAAQDELEVYRRYLAGTLPEPGAALDLAAVITPETAATIRQELAAIHVEPKVLAYVHDLVSATRTSPHLAWGASPRAGIALLGVARAWAAMEGRDFVIPDDIKRMVAPVMAHRILTTPEAELDGLDTTKVLDGILARVEVPR